MSAIGTSHSLVAQQQALTRQSIAYEVLGQQHEADRQVADILAQAAEAAKLAPPAPGKGQTLDIAV